MPTGRWAISQPTYVLHCLTFSSIHSRLLVQGFNMAITLRICWGGILVFYAKITTKLTKGSTIELQPVIRYEGVRHPKPCNYVPLHKLFNVYILDISQCLRLCPFGEVIDSYQNKLSITHGLGKWAENVQPPLCKGLGAVDWV